MFSPDWWHVHVVNTVNIQADHAEQLGSPAAGRCGRCLALLAAASRGEVDGLAAGERPGGGGDRRLLRHCPPLDLHKKVIIISTTTKVFLIGKTKI